jgi:sugar lactone lactonase YvrE
LHRILLLQIAGLAACGGGDGDNGGSQPPPLSLQVSPTHFSATFYPNQLPAVAKFYAVVAGETSSPIIYVLILDAGGAFTSGQASVETLGIQNYAAYLPTRADLQIGTHAGTLQIRVCGDLNCQSLLGQSSVAYTITIEKPVLLSLTDPLKASAMQEGGGNVALSATIQGARTDQPVYAKLEAPASPFSTATPVVLSHSVFSGEFEGSIATLANLADVTHAGNLAIRVCADADCQLEYGQRSVPYSLQVLKVFAGSPADVGSANGMGRSARFDTPIWLALDAQGTLFVTDVGNNTIRKITPAGYVTTVLTYATGQSQPGPLAVDSLGNIYFSDFGKRSIEKFTPRGDLSNYFAVDASGLSLDDFDNLYIANQETNSPQLWKVASDGTPVFLDPIVAFCVVPDSSGALLLTGDSLRRWTGPGAVTTVASLGSLNADIDDADNLFVTTPFNPAVSVFRVAPNGEETLLIERSVAVPDGQPFGPSGIAVTPDGRTLYLSDPTNHAVFRTTFPE